MMLNCTECEYEDCCSIRELAEDVTGCAGHGKLKEREEE